MAKKKTTHQPPAESDETAESEGTAKKLYEQVREETVEKLKGAREKRVGELIDDTLEAVKRHPGLGVIVAAVIGFFLGRMFRR